MEPLTRLSVLAESWNDFRPSTDGYLPPEEPTHPVSFLVRNQLNSDEIVIEEWPAREEVRSRILPTCLLDVRR